MALSEAELGRLAEDTYRDRIITGSVYCGKCGYNLHTLPYVYNCPECGSDYNARPLIQKGVFKLYEAHLPGGDIFTTLLCALITTYLVWTGVSPLNVARIWLGSVFFVLGAWYAMKAWSGLRQFVRARVIARRIAIEEGDDG